MAFIKHAMPLLMQVTFQEVLESQTCSNGLLVLIPFPPQKTQLSLKPRLVTDVLPNSAISFRASSLSLEKTRAVQYVNKIQTLRAFIAH